MPDITKCDNKKCPIRKKCYRFMAKPSKYMQAYSTFRCQEKLDFVKLEKAK
jgi:hypothetical protein